MDMGTIRDGRKVKDHTLHMLKMQKGIPIRRLHRLDPDYGVHLQCIGIANQKIENASRLVARRLSLYACVRQGTK